VGFGLVFAAMGGLFLVMIFGPMALGLIRSRHWVSTPCVIVNSNVEESHDSENGSTYRVAVRYRYQVDDRQYVGDRYNWTVGYSSGYSSKQRVVAALPPEADATCFVNPANPAESVLNRDVGWEAAFILLPLAFIAFGIVSIYAGIRSYSPAISDAVSPGGEWLRRKVLSGGQAANGFAGVWPAPAKDRGPRELRSSTDPRTQLTGLAFAAAIWNGIVGSILYFGGVWSHFSDVFDIVGAVFMIPFVLIGLGLIIGTIYSLLALRNPRPVVTIAKSILRLGDSVEVRWRVEGRTDTISMLNLTMEGREVATYHSGTDSDGRANTSTDKHVFERVSIAHVSDQMEIANGRSVLHLPERSMPSFISANNRVEWVLVVHGDIPNWPDVKEEFTLDVFGPEAKGASDADGH